MSTGGVKPERRRAPAHGGPDGAAVPFGPWPLIGRRGELARVTGTVFLIGTVPGDSPNGALWREDRCHRVDLEHLPRESVESLLFHALGAPVDGPTAHALWSTSQGNVLFLRELVLGAVAADAL